MIIRVFALTVVAAMGLAVLAPTGVIVPAVAPPAPGAAPASDAARDAPAMPRAGNAITETVIARSPDSHFYVDAEVNGAPVRFLVDSGASAVVLTPDDASRAGITALPADYTAEAQTANGTVRLKPVTLDRVAVGGIEAAGVAAAVSEGGLPVSLLGQSYLARLSKVEIEGDRMVLR